MRLPFDGNYPLTQHFGERPDYYKKYGLSGHNGLDFGTPHRTPILAPHTGTILEAIFDSGYGNYVKIENEEEGSVLAHLDEIVVRLGFGVYEGELIGYSDSTGDSSGPHLHWGYYKKPRNKENGYNGYVNQEPFVFAQSVQYTYKYNINDVIEPALDIPTGKSPGQEGLNYGHIGPKFRARIIGRENGYYNLDQQEIGGGTGWAKAELVDAAEPYKEPAPVSPLPPDVAPAEPIISEELKKQIKTLQDERNDAIEAAKELSTENLRLNGLLSGFKAMGFEKPEDITKIINTYDDTTIGIKTQIIQTLKRNKELLDLLAEKESEDATAIEEGIKGLEEAKRLRETLTEVSKKIGTSPKLFDILDHIDRIKSLAERFLNMSNRAGEKEEKSVKTVEKKHGIDWLLQILSLR